MRLRKAPYTEFRRVSISLADFSSVGSSPVLMLNNVPMMDLELKENELDMAKKLIKFMFFQDEENLIKLGRNSESMRKLVYGKSEKEIVQIVMYKLNSLYGEDLIIRSFFNFVRKHRKEVFLYLDDPDLEKTSDKTEQHFSIQSWLFKHKFKTKDGLLRTSYWYHWYLSTGN